MPQSRVPQNANEDSPLSKRKTRLKQQQQKQQQLLPMLLLNASATGARGARSIEARGPLAGFELSYFNSSSSSSISSSSISSSSSSNSTTFQHWGSQCMGGGAMQQQSLLLLLLLLPPLSGVSAGFLKLSSSGPTGAPGGPPPRGPFPLFLGLPTGSKSNSRRQLQSAVAAACSCSTPAAVAAAPAAAAPAAAARTNGFLRNVAIVAHVDHGKTTLVDALLAYAAEKQQQQQQHRKPPVERQLDREELERERGITIRAKVASLVLPLTSAFPSSSSSWETGRINLIDTPGHADFGGEVERVMHLADGILLVGPKPQTRVVLEKALRAGLRAVVAVNKVDRPTAKPEEVASRVFDLFLQLDATDVQADFEVVYTSALRRQSGLRPEKLKDSMGPLVEALWRLSPPALLSTNPTAAAAAAGAAGTATAGGAAAAAAAAGNAVHTLQLQVAHVSEDSFKGRLVLGKLQGGGLLPGSPIGIVRAGSPPHAAPARASAAAAVAVAVAAAAAAVAAAATFTGVYRYEGLELTPVDPELLQQQQQEAPGPLQGDLLVVGGLSEEVRVGDSLVDLANPRPLSAIRSEPPTVSVVLLPNASPLAGKDIGQPTTILGLRDKLKALIRNDISAKIAAAPGGLRLSGRGPLHIAVMIETLRRQGVELAGFGIRWSGSEWLEPYEDFEATVPSEALGAAMREVQKRHGNVTEVIVGDSDSSSSSTLLFRLATRFSFGLKAALMEAAKGAALLHSSPAGFLPLVDGLPPPRSAKAPPTGHTTAAAAAATAAAPGDGGRGEEEEEAELLLQQQQQQQRIPKEGEKQQASSRSAWSVKRHVEAGDASERQRGFLVAVEAGNATVKGILHAQERGQVFVSPGDEVYPGMLVGIHKRPNDLPVNICKAKKLTNMRAATKSLSESISPPLALSLDGALDLIGPGEVVEVTPRHIRLALRSALRS
ncbi:hypothetical protein Esti_001997 [Eimeria stiedai]